MCVHEISMIVRERTLSENAENAYVNGHGISEGNIAHIMAQES